MNIFITGATGFVGGATLVRLLADPRVDRVIALVRAADSAHGQHRIAASLARFNEPMPDARRLGVVVGALGDFDLPLEVRERVTHVVHAAAHTSFRSIRMARETNVEGTKALARAMENAPRLERFLFVGTAYRLGVAEASLVEEGLPSSAEHLVEYTRTKAEAEAHLESHRGLPLVIARPSIVVGHTKLGVRPSASLFWYYRALAQGALSPFAADRRRDIVPVDWVADAIVHLLLKPSLEHIRYHLSAGEVSADTWASIRDTFPPSVGSFDAWTLGAIEACAKFAQLSYDLFSNQRLLAEGMPPPPRFTSYLRRCIETSDRTVDEQARDDV